MGAFIPEAVRGPCRLGGESGPPRLKRLREAVLGINKKSDVLVVGAGLFGAVLAERVANDAGFPVTIVDRRGHIGGNCWSEVDSATGVEYHTYGSHIFHTSSEEVWNYVSGFTSFNNYVHTVWSSFNSRMYSMPINLQTINSFYGKNLTPDQAREFIAREIEKESIEYPENLEEKAISLIGRPLYNAFIRGYTVKQWEKDPKELPADIITRLPVRYTYNNRYFADVHEGIPVRGYAEMFKKLLAGPRISVVLNASYANVADSLVSENTLVCYTGAVDEFFGYRLGRLEWRTIDLEPERLPFPDMQGTSVVNYADVAVPFTRIHEFKHFHPEREDTEGTFIFKERSRSAGDNDEPYYPIGTPRNAALYEKYMDIARSEAQDVIFGGRLGHYKYYDMDDTVAAALQCYSEELLPRLTHPG